MKHISLVVAPAVSFALKIKQLIIIFCILIGSCISAFGNETFEFYNQELSDIVYILSIRSGQSIVCDKTVSGTGTFLYVTQSDETDFDEVFNAFCESNRLYLIKTPSLWTVSKIKVDMNSDYTLDINSYECSIANVFDKISEKTGKSIVYESLPTQRMSFHINNLSFVNSVKTILQPYSEYKVEETASGVKITRKENSFKDYNSQSEDSKCIIDESNNLYDAELKNISVAEVLDKLFFYSGESYSNFIQTSDNIKYLSFKNKDFKTALMLILEQVNCEYIYSDGIWYLVQKSAKSSKDSVIERQRKWQSVTLLHTSVSKVIPILTSKYQGIIVSEINNANLALFVTDAEFIDITEYLKNIDSKFEMEVIQLRYIKTNELYAVLPPSISKEEVIDTGTGNSIFFIGSSEKKEIFLELLKEIDQPKKLVRYDLLILQYDKNSNLSWGSSMSVKPSQIGDRTLVYGELGNLLNINFDAITSFGLTFSEKINSAISSNNAFVVADTTLYGLSGEKIEFKNTNTYRYKDATIDTTTGKEVYSTVTREITSGLILDINGWVSGDDIITMEVKTSVSKQGIDVSNKTGNPPPTTEKNITTKIRAKNGDPVVLSGLSQSDLSDAEQGVPGISKIPLFGNLFKSKSVSNSKSEMTIYLVPHIEENMTTEDKPCWEELLYSLVDTAEKNND